MLGQFSSHARLDRTIQNKTFEALALGMPYITRDSKSNREVLEDGKNCLLVKPSDPEDLAKKIILLKNNEDLRKKIADQAHSFFQNNLTSDILGSKVFDLIKKVL